MKQLIPNSFNLTVYADDVVTATKTSELIDCYKKAQKQNKPVLILGQGTNTLFTRDYNGVVILNRIKGITVTKDDNHYFIKIGAGEIWHDLVTYTINHHMPGLENLALIPGCLGSAAIQNIGAYGVEFKKFADYVELLSLKSGETIIVTDGKYGYRDSIFKHQYQQNYVITAVGLKIKKNWQAVLDYGDLKQLDKDQVTPKMIYDKVCEIRRQKLPDPTLLGNAGSFFTNPIISRDLHQQLISQFPAMPSYLLNNGDVKVAAAWLIDQCGLKNYQIGGAAVHDKQALVLVNKNNATPNDIIALAKHVKQQVLQKFNINMTAEIKFIGSEHEIDSETLLNAAKT